MIEFTSESDDHFETIVKIHRFFGLGFYGFHEKESKLKTCFQVIYQILVHSYIILLTLPCVTQNLICLWFTTHTITANRQMFMHFFSRNFICLISGIVYSLKGKQFQKLITKLRKTILNFEQMIVQTDDSFAIHRRLIYYQFLSILVYVVGMFCTTYNLNYITIPLPLFCATLIAEIYNQPILFATDFYLIYFTYYIKLIQTSFRNRLKLIALTPAKETGHSSN